MTCSLITVSECCPAEKLRIITPLKNTEAKEGQEVVLNCEVNQEGAKAKWLKNEETLFESSKYVMVQRDNVFSLRIRDAQKGDEANYSINLTNQRGEQAKSSGSLSVKGQWSTVMGFCLCWSGGGFRENILDVCSATEQMSSKSLVPAVKCIKLQNEKLN